MRPPTLLKAPGEYDSLRQAEVNLQNKHAGQRNGGGWKLVTIGTVTFRMLKGGEDFPVSRLCGPVSFTHTRPHIPTLWTHKQTTFTGSEVVETGKQAEGRKKFYSASHSKTEPW